MLAHRVPATFQGHDRSRRRLAGVHAGVFALLVTAAGAAEVNRGYPSGIVGLKPGLLLCTSLAEVERAFEYWRMAYEQHAPERLADGCARIPAGYAATIEYFGAFRNRHWYADLLRFSVFREAAPGILIFDDVYYGYGSAKPRQDVLPTLERPLYQ
jgi:hypothetical protein